MIQMPKNEHETNEPSVRVDYWRFIDRATYDVDYDAFGEKHVWANKTSRMVWDSERREFVGENRRVPVDQVKNAVHV
jgi:hypothetical protein